MAKATSIYTEARKQAGLTQAEASEQMATISEDRLARIEAGRINVTPEDILEMADTYKRPDLCNHFCTQECAIGRETVRPVERGPLSEIVLKMLASLNAMDKEKNRLIEITADGQISEDEFRDFAKIQHQLNRISDTVDAMKLWIDQTIANGGIDPDEFEKAQREITD